MLIKVDQKPLNDALSAVNTVVIAPKKDALIMVYHHVMLNAFEGPKGFQGYLELTGANETGGLKVKIPFIDVDEPGGITIEAHRFLEFISTLKEKGVTSEKGTDTSIQLKLDNADTTLLLTCKSKSGSRHRAKFVGLSVDEFPLVAFSTDEDSFTVSTHDLIKAISLTERAIAHDENHPVLTGVHITCADNRLYFESADGFRLSMFNISAPNKEAFDKIIPGDSIIKLKGLLNIKYPDVKISTVNNKNTIVFETGDITFSTQLIDGNFPKLNRILEGINPVTFVTFDREPFRKAVIRAIILGDKQVVKLEVNSQAGQINVGSWDTIEGDIESNVPATITGPDLILAINGTFLTAALASTDAETIKMSFENPGKPLLFAAVGEDAFTHVIMPIHMGK